MPKVWSYLALLVSLKSEQHRGSRKNTRRMLVLQLQMGIHQQGKAKFPSLNCGKEGEDP